MMRVGLLLVVSLLSGFVTQAQIAKDTTINNRPFVIHIVQSQETLYGIAREYSAELNEIVVQNPAVIQGLKVGGRLLFPLQQSSFLFFACKWDNLCFLQIG